MTSTTETALVIEKIVGGGRGLGSDSGGKTKRPR